MSRGLTPEERRERKRARNTERMRRVRESWTPEEWEALREKNRQRYRDMSPEKKRAKVAADARRRHEKQAAAKAASDALKAAQEAKRKAMMPAIRKKNRETLDANPKYVHARIVNAIPRSYPADVRDDVAADLVVALLDGDISIDEIERSVRRFISAHYEAREWGWAGSIDQVISGTESLTLGDTIPADALHF